MKNMIFVTAAAAAFLFSAPLAAQVSENSPTAEPMDQNQTPGLQQTPDGQTVKMAVEKDRPSKENQVVPARDAASPTSSTGPTFPNDRPAK